MHLRPTRSETNQSVIPFSEEPFNNSSDRRDRTRSQRRGLNFRAEGRESGFDVAQTFAPGQLGESQHEKLFIGGEFADAAVAVVTGDTFVELVFVQEVEELGEDGATFVHKVKNRRLAVEHPLGVVVELKSKKDRTARTCRFYRAEIAVRKILTGQ